ncbi:MULTISPECIES: NAD(P)/FAD-dependent oxidoreductase [Rhodococcus]|uniref:flavin-containing monooxygenase n=1 Tax=Nocardiaceae TaxID=85025 RepID=UPI00197E8C50|nr:MULTISPECIES: NAD(P)/FAD-dependent oxidoreductase [Rhodococcus]
MRTNDARQVDVVVVGAGFSGLYLLWKLRGQGLNVRLFEAGDDVGGTWFWNRYPGARCDVESVDYSFSFDDALQQEWTWKERYPAQPEILAYLQHVADRFDLRRDISLNTRIQSARYDETTKAWTVYAAGQACATARFVIMATGCLSVPQTPNIAGLESFTGDVYHTGNWPTEGVDFTGKRVAVLGTGSSGIQLIPEVARQADHLTVLQRTASFSVPAMNGPLDPRFEAEVKANYPERRRRARASSAGVERGDNPQNALDVSAEDRAREFDSRWGKGGFALLGAYQDLMLTDDANDTVADYVRAKIRATVHDPDIAESLIPRGYPLGAKRICVDTDYFETYNRGNVTLVDLRRTPLELITPTGARTTEAEYDFDIICLATGFDAMTGALDRIDIRGSGGQSLKSKWQHGPTTYLGLGVAGFPNLLLIAGSGSPSVLANMVTAIEQHVEWTSDCLAYMDSHGYETIEPTQKAEDEWVAHVNEMASYTVFPKAASWYMGANVPGKPQIFMPYVGGCVEYEKKCNAVADEGYSGFVLK